MKTRGSIAAAVLCCAASFALAQTQVLTTGSTGELWLVAYDRDAQQLTVRQRGNLSTWQGKAPSAPAVACAAGENLHVFFPGDGHSFFNYRLARHVGAWPSPWTGAKVLAGCPSRTAPALFLMIESDGSQPSTAATAPFATQPAAAPDTTPAASLPSQTQPATAGGGRPVIQRYAFGQWSHVADLPEGPQSTDAAFHMTELNGVLHVLACDTRGHPQWLSRLVDGRWESLPQLPWEDEDGQVVGFEAVHDLWLVNQGSHGGQPALWLRRIDQSKVNPPERILLADGSAVSPDEGTAPAVARTGAQLALVWRQESQWKVGNLELSGRVENVQPLAAGDSDAHLHRIAEFVQWGYFVAVGVLMALWYVRRRALARVPFLLPPQLAPGHWVKRLIAFAVDFMPITLAAMYAFGIDPSDERLLSEYLERARQGEGVGRPELTGLLAIGAYCLYCIVLETATGTTVGKRLLGLQVVDENGRRPGPLAIVMRNVLKLVELQVPILFVAAVWPILSAYRQRFGDAIARTAVVNRKLRSIMPPPAPPGESTPQQGDRSK